jgi:hypothetical protein
MSGTAWKEIRGQINGGSGRQPGSGLDHRESR